MKPTIVTVANRRPVEPYYLYDEFFASCRKLGYEPLVLGTQPGDYQGMGTKPRLLKKAIEGGLIKSDVIVFTDCFDVVLAADPSEFKWEGDIEFCAERNCFPDTTLADKHPPSHTPYKYLNSGFSMGLTESYLAALIEMKAQDIRDETASYRPDDQDSWMKLMIDGGSRITLDHECAMCQAMLGAGKDELIFPAGGRIKNVLTGKEPMAFHFNGGAKTEGLREPVLAALGF